MIILINETGLNPGLGGMIKLQAPAVFNQDLYCYLAMLDTSTVSMRMPGPIVVLSAMVLR